MRPSLRALSGLVLASCVLATWPAEAAQETTSRYVAGSDPALTATAGWLGVGPRSDPLCGLTGVTSVGGVCVRVPARAKRVSILVTDVSTRGITGSVELRTDGGRVVAGPSAPFCRATAVRVPKGAALLVVHVHTTVLACADDPGVPTSGTVLARFR